MSRYIDADKYLEKAQYEARAMPQDCGFAEYTDWLIGKTPSIDIVRCKECKYASNNKVYGCMLNHFNDNDYDYHRMYADDFCSYGEREGE